MKTGNLKYKDILDVRDIIERIEELEEHLEGLGSEGDAAMQNLTEEWQELQALTDIMNELQGNGGDEQWRGDWYPVMLIRGSYFGDYAQELAADCGDYPKRWPYTCIDWAQAARELQMDYTPTEIDGVTFWYR
jgi:hypothetical protein